MPAFGLPPEAIPLWLGEGDTPLVERGIEGHRVYFKCEHLNPSGSFKDRQSAVLMSLIRTRGITEILEDSSGNAGASLAQYAAAAGIRSQIFIPAESSGPKRKQIELSGAEVILVDGLRANAAIAVREAHEKTGLPYASHALLPFGLAAYATIAFEIYETLGKMPGRVFAPIGHGSLFLGLLLGFEAIQAHVGDKRPLLIGVQAQNCAPVYRKWHQLSSESPRPSLAEGTAVSEPVRGTEILERLNRASDALLAVKEHDIARSHKNLAKMGFYVEPTSAMVWAAGEQLIEEQSGKEDDWVFILTGNGLKS